ncbi:MAG: hypothetical protein ABI640_13170 [Gammaproteobacteria bacterium]
MKLFKATVLVGGENKSAQQPRLLSMLAYAKNYAQAEQMADKASGGIARGILIEEGPAEMPVNVEQRVLHGVTFYVERRVLR